MSCSEGALEECPVCYNRFARSEIERHVDKCIFLNEQSDASEMQKRKRASPSFPKKSTQNESPTKKLKTENEGVTKYFKPKLTSVTTKKDTNSKPEPIDVLADYLMAVSNDHKTNAVTTCEPKKFEDNYGFPDEKPSAKKFSFSLPLAAQVQPKALSDFFGQNQILGGNSILRSALENGEVPNMILWGPPGCGKTSLSSVIKEICKKNSTKLKFVSLCAATSGVKEVQAIIAKGIGELKYGRKTILFMDEIHRFNKKQQDTFLLHVEKGDIILIGATTENPSFFLNSALLSRCRVIVMEKLSPEDLRSILRNAASYLGIAVIDDDYQCLLENSCGIESKALTWLADISDGDARIALGNLELVVQHKYDANTVISVDDIKEEIKKSHILYDRKGEEHYNVISAMHKSIRGSDPNAALYWTTRMIVGGEDPLFIARRMVRAASEDIGNADPNALQLAVTTMQGCQLLGMPESDVLLAQCAIYLARAPKSREADSALARAKTAINEHKGLQPSVPLHLRNAPTKLMKELGYGKVASGSTYSFMPPDLAHVDFFK